MASATRLCVGTALEPPAGWATRTPRTVGLMAGFESGRVLVTGATGFIGGRLVERLMWEGQTPVRALLRSYSSAARIARFPVELARADILDADAVAAAAEGCDVIFHLAYGSRGSPDVRRQVTVEGTRNVLQAARQTSTGEPSPGRGIMVLPKPILRPPASDRGRWCGPLRTRRVAPRLRPPAP